jgi:hypothetical protein
MLIQSCVFRPCICFLVLLLGSTNSDGTGTIFSSDIVFDPMLAFECFWKLNNIANYEFLRYGRGCCGPTGRGIHDTHVPTIVRTTPRIATHRHASPLAGHSRSHASTVLPSPLARPGYMHSTSCATPREGAMASCHPVPPR